MTQLARGGKNLLVSLFRLRALLLDLLFLKNFALTADFIALFLGILKIFPLKAHGGLRRPHHLLWDLVAMAKD